MWNFIDIKQITFQNILADDFGISQQVQYLKTILLNNTQVSLRRIKLGTVMNVLKK